MSEPIPGGAPAPKPSLSDAACLPIGPCPKCEREVLAYLLPDGVEGFACVHCDGVLRHVQWVEEEELGEVGYDAWDPLAGGCGTGCASGGCARR